MSDTQIILATQLTSYRPKADGSWSISFSTMILNKDQKAIIDSLFQRNCALLIKSSDIDKKDETIMDSIDMDLYDNAKTPSQRMRGVFYRIWEGNGKCDRDGVICTFAEYYKQRMAQQIELLKMEIPH